jgi:hypothetical protein
LGLVVGALAAPATAATQSTTPPATALGIWSSAEDSGTYSTVSGQTPDVANYYLDWGSPYPQSFFTPAQDAGATAFLEMEPWIGAQGDDTCTGSGPAMTTIGANGSAIQTYAKSLGSAIASAGKPVIITFAHEFNVSGQYPWAQGDCEGTTGAQWVTAWDAFRNDIDSTANGLAYFMWVPDVFNGAGGTVIDPSPYWPGAANVDMVGVDGYPQSQYGETTFANTFADTFSIIKGLPGESTIAQPKIFVAETNFSPLDSGSYESIPNMVSDICSNGGDGTLQFVGYSDEPNLSATQWNELDTAQAADCGSSSPTPSAPVVSTGAASAVTSTTATLNGTVNPEGEATTYQFQYGTSTGYGSLTPASPASAGSGSSAVNESAALSGLTAGTTYDYRLVATNATGTTDGANQTFTTSSGTSSGGAFTAVGGLIQGTSLTPSVTTHAVGDVILLHVTTEGSAPPTGISGGDATWTQVGTTVRGSVNSGLSAAVYEGTVTSAGTATATITTSGTPSAVRIGGQEYNPGSGQTGVLVAQANLDVTGTNTGPSITPTASNELYSFYGFDTDIGSSGSTSGYTYELDDYGNIYTYDPASPTQAPVFGDSNVAFGIAVLMESEAATTTTHSAFTPVSGLIQSQSLTPSITTHAVGDVVLLHVITEGSAPPTGISGGDATWTQVGTTVRGSVNSGLSAAVYEGTVTSAGTATATITTSGTPSAVRIAGQEYNPGSGQTGVLIAQANLDVTGTNTGPSITPTASNELYSFYGFDTDIGSSGSTSGYTYELDDYGNIYTYDPASPTQAPIFGDSNVAFGIAVLMESAPA